MPRLDVAPPTSSFPSGHTAAAVALYGCLALVVLRQSANRWAARTIAVLCCCVPVIVAVSRVYRGMHYLTDVLGGVLLGTVWLYAAVHGIRLGVAHWQLRHGGGAGDWRGRRSAVRHG